jgi:predicted RNA-binding Zn ribbon-like protein
VTPSRAGSLSLVGGVLALDFANTGGGRDTDAPAEHLQRPAHIVDWAVHAGAIAPRAAKTLHAVLARDAEAAGKLLRQAISLRESIHRIGAALAQGRKPAEADLQNLRDVARRAMGVADLAPGSSGGYGFDFSAAPPEAALLGPVAWSAIALLERGNFERLKQCPGPDCGWLFFDHSKNNSRRWCDMATCGNRDKVQRHRARQ